MKVYLAGPMSGYPENNYPAFVEGAEMLRLAGYEVYSPNEAHPASEFPYSEWTWETFLRNDLRLMLTCDMVVFLQGSFNSRGARLEMGTAQAVGMRVVSLVEALMEADYATMYEQGGTHAAR